jgi:hypothetical protein
VPTKICTKCRVELSLDAFNKGASAKDGLQYHCKACKLEYQRNNPNRAESARRYRAANRRECVARSIASHKKKPEYYSAQRSKWVAENRESVLAKRRANYKRNNGMDLARSRRRRGRIKQDISKLTAPYIAEIQGLYDFCSIFPGYEVDHIVPLNGATVSGLHVPWNLQILPISENRRKGNTFNPESHLSCIRSKQCLGNK